MVGGRLSGTDGSLIRGGLVEDLGRHIIQKEPENPGCGVHPDENNKEGHDLSLRHREGWKSEFVGKNN